MQARRLTLEEESLLEEGGRESVRGRRTSGCACRGQRALVREKGSKRESVEVQRRAGDGVSAEC